MENFGDALRSALMDTDAFEAFTVLFLLQVRLFQAVGRALEEEDLGPRLLDQEIARATASGAPGAVVTLLQIVAATARAALKKVN